MNAGEAGESSETPKTIDQAELATCERGARLKQGPQSRALKIYLVTLALGWPIQFYLAHILNSGIEGTPATAMAWLEGLVQGLWLAWLVWSAIYLATVFSDIPSTNNDGKILK